MNRKIKAEHYQVFYQDMIHDTHTMGCDFYEEDEAEIYTEPIAFSYTGVMVTTKDGRLGDIEIIIPKLQPEPPGFFRKPVPLDAEIKEFTVRSNPETQEFFCFVDEGTVFWQENAGTCVKAVDCGDIVFYLDEETTMIGFLIKIKEWNPG